MLTMTRQEETLTETDRNRNTFFKMSSRDEMKIRMQLKLKYTRVKTQNRVAQNYEKEQLEGSEEERERTKEIGNFSSVLSVY